MAATAHLLLLLVISGVSLSRAAIASSSPPRVMDENERYIHTLTHKSSEAARNGTTLAAVLRGPNRQRIVGVEGVNFEMNGTEPYLVCALYNPTVCDPALRSDCPNTEICYLNGAHTVLACLTVFKTTPPENKSNVSTFHDVPKKDIDFQGCQELMDVDPEEFKRKKCVGQIGHKFNFRSCLCHTKMCNEVGNVQVESLPPKLEENGDAEENSTQFVLFLVGGTLFVFLSAIGVLAYVIWMALKKRRSRSTLENKAVIEPMLDSEDIELQPVTAAQPSTSTSADEPSTSTAHQQHEPTYNITDLEKIGRGRYGLVHRANLNTDDATLPRRVAVKIHDMTEVDSYLAEKRIFEQLAALPQWCPAILRFLIAEQVGNELWIVTEYHERHSLYTLLKKNTISLAGAVRIMLSAVDGLQFLHDDLPYFFQLPKPVIIHRDIKSKNILIRKDMTAVIADFGLARVYEMNNKKNNGLFGQVGTRRYMAPEVLEAATEFSASAFKQMDVYAMALVMWEVMSRVQLEDESPADVPPYQLPYEVQIGNTPPTIQAMRDIVVRGRVRPTFREALSRSQRTRDLKSIIVEMWDTEANGRITAGCAFDRIVKMVLEDQLHRPVDDNDVKRIWTEYLHAPTTTPYPSADPAHFLPPPPPYPEIGEETGEGEVVDARDSGRMQRRQREPIYDSSRKRFLTDAEVADGRVYEEFQAIQRVPSPDVSEFELTDDFEPGKESESQEP